MVGEISLKTLKIGNIKKKKNTFLPYAPNYYKIYLIPKSSIPSLRSKVFKNNSLHLMIRVYKIIIYFFTSGNFKLFSYALNN